MVLWQKKVADKSGTLFGKQSYCKWRNHVTRLNKGKKKGFYQHNIDEVKDDGKKTVENVEHYYG